MVRRSELPPGSAYYDGDLFSYDGDPSKELSPGLDADPASPEPDSPSDSDWTRRYSEIEALADKWGCSLYEAACRLGIKNPDEERDKRSAEPSSSKKMARQALVDALRPSTVRCGDCGAKLSPGDRGCSHMRVGPRGGVYFKDTPGFLRGRPVPKKKRPLV